MSLNEHIAFLLEELSTVIAFIEGEMIWYCSRFHGAYFKPSNTCSNVAFFNLQWYSYKGLKIWLDVLNILSCPVHVRVLITSGLKFRIHNLNSGDNQDFGW